MKTTIVITITLLLMAWSLQSQTLTAGFEVSEVLSSHDSLLSLEPSPITLSGIRVAANIRLDLGDRISVQAGIGLTLRRWDVVVYGRQINDWTKLEGRIRHLDQTVPLSLRIRPFGKSSVSPFILAGGELYCANGARVKFNDDSDYQIADVRAYNGNSFSVVRCNVRYFLGAGIETYSKRSRIIPSLHIQYYPKMRSYFYGGTNTFGSEAGIRAESIEITLGLYWKGGKK